MKQATLDFTPAPVRLPLPLAAVVAEDRPRLHRAALLILGRLQCGPATGAELVAAGGGFRFGARVEELRKAGHQITSERLSDGAWPYTLSTEER